MKHRQRPGASREWIRGLEEPSAYGHAVGRIRVIETHISWVVLTGQFAYKVKKPVNLGFLDFSTLERRKACCEEELRVNRRTAPDWYLGVVPIASTADGLRVGAEPADEYAVRMRQFPHDARLDRCLREGRIGPGEIRRLAGVIAQFHQRLPPRAGADPRYESERATKPARQNFVHLDPADFSDEAQQRLAVVEAWTLQQAGVLEPVFEYRAQSGAVRECHGDLHLENLLFIDGRFIPFDAIEFSPELRWIDVANDVAFLAMDLLARDRRDLAYGLLSAWLEETGDYDSLAVMRYYLVYRSMVRAVVLAIRERQKPAPDRIETSYRQGAERYVELAAEGVDTPAPTLYLMHGLSGSGKTWHSERLVRSLEALRVRSDLERKRLPGLDASKNATGTVDSGLYAAEITERTYHMLARHCTTGLRAGFNMMADAAFLRRWQRQLLLEAAERCGASTVIVNCTAPENLLRERVRRRLAARSDASDADLDVLEHQMSQLEPLTESERRISVTLGAHEDAAAAFGIHAAAHRNSPKQ